MSNFGVARESLAEQTLKDVYGALPYLLRLPAGKAWIDYDQEADVLCVSLKRPQPATDTRSLEDEGILLRYRGKELVGITILDASKRSGDAGTVAAASSLHGRPTWV